MKTRLLLIALLALLAVAPAYGATAHLELFADATMSSCSLTDTPGVMHVYVIHTAGEPALGVQFSAPKPACWNATWVGDSYSPNSGANGNSQTLAAVAYGVCRTPPAVAVRMDFVSAGTTGTCCKYATSGAGLYADCIAPEYLEHPLEFGPNTVTINADETCPCMLTVSTESSTWGRVKSLYR